MTHIFKVPEWAKWVFFAFVALFFMGTGAHVNAQTANGFRAVGPEKQSISSRRSDGKAVRVFTMPATNGREEGVIARVQLEGFQDKLVGIGRSSLPELEASNYPDVVSKGWFDFISRIGRALRDFLNNILKKLKKEASQLLKQLLRILEEYIGEILTAVLSSAALSDEEKATSAEESAKAFSRAAKSNQNVADKLNMALKTWVDQSSAKARPIVVSAIQSSLAKRAAR
jgi:hypothetical protein